MNTKTIAIKNRMPDNYCSYSYRLGKAQEAKGNYSQAATHYKEAMRHGGDRYKNVNDDLDRVRENKNEI